MLTDLPEIVRCVRAAYEPYVSLMDREPAPMTDDYAPLVRAGDVRVAVAAAGSAVVGVLVCRLASDHVFVDNVAVSPAAQGTGVGRTLLALADDDARRAGVGEVRLYTNEVMTQNLEMYPRLGFVETHRQREAGFARVYFTKVLADA